MLTEADLAKLAALVERCRQASADLEIARADGDRDDRDAALNFRDAAERALGAEWQAIGDALAELDKAQKAFGNRHSPERQWRPGGGHA